MLEASAKMEWLVLCVERVDLAAHNQWEGRKQLSPLFTDVHVV